MTAIPVGSYADAIAAYNRAARADVGGGGEAAPRDDGFARLVRDAVHQAVKSGEHAEKESMAALVDGTDLNTVVTAVAEAETLLQTVMAVRDRVIEAYKDVMRMPV